MGCPIRKGGGGGGGQSTSGPIYEKWGGRGGGGGGGLVQTPPPGYRLESWLILLWSECQMVVVVTIYDHCFTIPIHKPHPLNSPGDPENILSSEELTAVGILTGMWEWGGGRLADTYTCGCCVYSKLVKQSLCYTKVKS